MDPGSEDESPLFSLPVEVVKLIVEQALAVRRLPLCFKRVTASPRSSTKYTMRVSYMEAK